MGEKEEKYLLREATGLTRAISGVDAYVLNALTPALFLPLTETFFWAPYQWPGGNAAWSWLLSIVPNLFIAYLYAQLTVAMPRTGGDYVWVSRIMHPSLGFLVSFMWVFVTMSWVGTCAVRTFTWYFNVMFYNLGTVMGNTAFMSLATTLSDNVVAFVLGTVLIIILGSIFIAGTRFGVKVVEALYGIAMIGVAAFLIGCLLTPQSVFAQNFNTMTGLNYSNIIQLGKDAGFTPGFTWSATLLMWPSAFQALICYNWSAYWTGEVKKARASQIWAITLGALTVGLLMTALAAATYYTMGPDFLGAVDFIFYNTPDKYPLSFQPTMNYFIPMINSNPLFVFLVSLSFAIFTMNLVVMIFMFHSRIIFAWAFDRLVPSRLANVNERFHTPHWAIITTMIFGIIFEIIWIWTDWLKFYVNTMTGWWIATAIVGIAGIFLYYRKRSIFEQAPSFARQKIGGIPAIVLVGLIVTGVSLFVAYAVLTVVALATVEGMGLLLAVLIGCPLYYFIVRAYYNRKGLPMDKVTAEIPPE